jgi:hypothetical protein
MTAGTTLTITGIDTVLASLKGLQGDLRSEANAELRAAARQIASDVIPLLGGSGAPQEAALLASLGPRSDRLVTVAVVRKPKLSGLRKTRAAEAKGLFWPVELGSGAPQFHGPPAGGMVGKHREALARYALPRYTAAVAALLRKYNLL